MDRLFVPLPARGTLLLTGEDRVAFIQGLVSNDVARVAADRAVYAALLTAQGRYLHDFFLAAHGDALVIEGERERLPDLKRRLGLYKLRSKVALAEGPHEVFAAFGPAAPEALGLAPGRGAAAPLGDGVAFVDPRLAELGARLVLPQGGADLLRSRGFAEAEPLSYDRLRLALGVPDGSRDLIVEKAILLESGFDELAGIDWQKGCYMGQELTARTKYRGLVRKRLMPVRIEGPAPAPGTPVMAGAAEAGEMRSAAGDLGLALLRLEAVEKSAPLTAGEARLTPLKPSWAVW